MFGQYGALFSTSNWWGYGLRIAGFYLLAWLVHRLARRLARRMTRVSRFTPRALQPRPERQITLQSLIASTISLVAFAAATLVSVGQFVPMETLVWVVGLFSAAFGLGARPLIGDVLSGLSFIFEDTFAVGEKVETLEVEGIVEAINLRTTWIRSPTGELYIVPNGEVRVVRNFSRGSFSSASVRLKVTAVDLNRVLPLLETLGQEAVSLLPNLLEPWQIISENGTIGQKTELTLLAKARFGKGAEMRPRLLALVQERLTEAGVTLAN
jgi:small-conductance mechanosensitive channel